MQYIIFPLIFILNAFLANITAGVINAIAYLIIVLILYGAGRVFSRDVGFYDALSAHNMAVLGTVVLALVMSLFSTALRANLKGPVEFMVNLATLQGIIIAFIVFLVAIVVLSVRVYMVQSMVKSILISVLYFVLCFVLMKIGAAVFPGHTKPQRSESVWQGGPLVALVAQSHTGEEFMHNRFSVKQGA